MTNPPMPQGGIPHKEISREALEGIEHSLSNKVVYLSENERIVPQTMRDTLAATQTALYWMDEAEKNRVSGNEVYGVGQELVEQIEQYKAVVLLAEALQSEPHMIYVDGKAPVNNPAWDEFKVAIQSLRAANLLEVGE